jgi:hypothetical protein
METRKATLREATKKGLNNGDWLDLQSKSQLDAGMKVRIITMTSILGQMKMTRAYTDVVAKGVPHF